MRSKIKYESSFNNKYINRKKKNNNGHTMDRCIANGKKLAIKIERITKQTSW
jgi:hypothetical protein